MKIRMYRIIDTHTKLQPDSYWFSDKTMKFFKTRLPFYGYLKGDITYFITSENDGVRGRKYSIRTMNESGEIDTYGEFYQYSKTEANRILAYDRLCKKIRHLRGNT